MTKGRGMMTTCAHVKSPGRICGLKFSIDGHFNCPAHRRCSPEVTCEVCEDWSESRWAQFRLRVVETKKRSERVKDGVLKVQLGVENLLGPSVKTCPKDKGILEGVTQFTGVGDPRPKITKQLEPPPSGVDTSSDLESERRGPDIESGRREPSSAGRGVPPSAGRTA